MTLLPCHGRIACRRCWDTTTDPSIDIMDRTSFRQPQRFHIENNPGAWGAQNPKIMVLGQTKGFTQSDAMRDAMTATDFAQVAFADCRSDLHGILKSLDLAKNVTSLDPLFKSSEKDWHWGSVIRCTLAAWDDAMDKETMRPKGWSSASGLVGKSYRSSLVSKFPYNCVQQFLSDLPDRLRLVIVLGNSSDHVKRVRGLIAQTHQADFSILPEAPDVAYRAGGATWVHIVHPSGSARGYHRTFKEADPNTTQGDKALQARAAIASAGL